MAEKITVTEQMSTSALKEQILSGACDRMFKTLYGAEKIESARKRYADTIDGFTEFYGERESAMLLSVPGRSEITGNHTDHNHGRVIAASVDCDVIAVAAPGKTDYIRIKSEGYKEDVADPNRLEPENYPSFKSASLVAGMCCAFRKSGYEIGALDAYTTSNVLKGSGLSSSAAFEVMVGTILNHLYNAGAVDPVTIAKFAQWAENVYFGKPCGLMDQMACAVGGFVKIDFKNPESPEIEKINFDLSGLGYDLCIVNTGGSHADLNDDYAAIPAEMKAVAKILGREVLRGTTEEELIERAAEIRSKAGDRALLRAFHFVKEDARVPMVADAMRKGDISAFLEGISLSGNSSFKYLQNVFSTSCPGEQGETLALYMAERALRSYSLPGACRVHGGGFAGTMQAFVPRMYTKAFCRDLERVMGKNACMPMRVRPVGAVRIL